MKQPKWLLPFKGTTIIQDLINALVLSGFEDILTVAAEPYGSRIERHLENSASKVLWNHRPEEGMLSSVRIGLRGLSSNSHAAVVIPADHAGLKVSTLKAVVAGNQELSAALVVAAFNGKRGHPLLIGRDFFEEVLSGCEEMGLRELLALHPDKIRYVETGDPAVVRDIDTPEDYQSLLASL